MTLNANVDGVISQFANNIIIGGLKDNEEDRWKIQWDIHQLEYWVEWQQVKFKDTFKARWGNNTLGCEILWGHVE